MRKIIVSMILMFTVAAPSYSTSVLLQGGYDVIGSSKYGNGWEGSARVEVPVVSKLSLGGEFEYLGESSHPIYGSLSGYGFLGELILRPVVLGRLHPYLLGGIGYYHWDWTRSQYLKDAGITVDLHDSVGYKVGAGLDYPIDSHWSVNVEYAFYKADLEVNPYYPDGTHAHVIGDSTLGNEGQEIKLGVRYTF